MRNQSIAKKPPLSLGENCLLFKVGEKEGICVNCDPNIDCDGDCERFRKELKKIKERRKENER